MKQHNEKQITRKDFLRKTSAGLLTFGLLGGTPLRITKADQDQTKTSPEFRILGRTGMKVSAVGFGASRTMEPTLLKAALDKGINFIDTGRHYFNGQNEVMVGKVIKGIRKDVIIQSKLNIKLKKKKNEELDLNGSSKRIISQMHASLNESLKALQTDYIDILIIRNAKYTELINYEAIMEFFNKAKEKGQIRACGFAEHTNQVEMLKAANESKFYDVVMVSFNHKGAYTHSKTNRKHEWDQQALEIELQKAHKNNLGIIAMKTCSGGPYTPDGESEPSYRAALKWILEHNYISTMAVAMGNINELNEDIQAMF